MSIKKLYEFLYAKFNKYKTYIFLGGFALVLLYAGYVYYYKYFYLFKSPKELKKIIMSYGNYSLFVFLMLQIIQVIVFFIPGEVVQVCGGYIYGTFFGGVISLVGITIGSACAYGISNLLGKPFVEKLSPKNKIIHFERALNNRSRKLVVFLIYVIPGIPKDIVAYICGVSIISFVDFIIYSTLGRIPGIFISAYFGAAINSGKKAQLIIISILMTSLFSIGVYKGEKIIKKITKKTL